MFLCNIRIVWTYSNNLFYCQIRINYKMSPCGKTSITIGNQILRNPCLQTFSENWLLRKALLLLGSWKSRKGRFSPRSEIYRQYWHRIEQIKAGFKFTNCFKWKNIKFFFSNTLSELQSLWEIEAIVRG